MSIRSRSSSLQHVVDGIYDASMDAGLWPEVIGEIAAYGNSSFATFIWRDEQTNAHPVVSHRVETGFTQLMNEYYVESVASDPILRVEKATVDVPVLIDDLEPRQTFLPKSPAHARWFREWNVKDRAIVLVKPGLSLKSIAALTLARGVGEEDFDRRSLRALADLSPHLRRSTQISARLRRETERKHSLVTALQQVQDGVFFVDSVGRVVFTNAAAENFVARGVLSIVHQRLRAPRAADQTAMERMLRQAILTGEGRAADPGGRVPLHAADGSEQATLSIAPLRVNSPGESAGSARAVIFVKEHKAPDAAAPETLRAAFGLTRAEARVAVGLLQGRRLDEIAAEHGVGKETLRSQLRGVFDKTGVNRQADLVKVLLNMPHGGTPSRGGARPGARLSD